MFAVEARGLSKTFVTRVRPEGLKASLRSLVKPEKRTIDAVKSVDFEVDEGEIVAFLGPNGAGKSTTIKMLSGILVPSAGSARVLGYDPSRERLALAREIGAVFGQRSQLWYHLPASDSFRLLAAIYDLDRAEYLRARGELVERFGIADLMDVPVRKLSLGQRIRCEIAASLLHSPKLLFLDEPTIGLDVVVKREIRALLSELAKSRGVTIFMTSHDIGDIEKVCKRAIVIHHGEVVLDESMKDLKHRATARKYVGVKWHDAVDPELPGLAPIKSIRDAASYVVDTRRHTLRDVIAALAARGEIADITVEDEPLEEVIAGIFAATSASEASAFASAGKASGGQASAFANGSRTGSDQASASVAAEKAGGAREPEGGGQ
jgi:ABC-2 type transport system ATP-binding protein